MGGFVWTFYFSAGVHIWLICYAGCKCGLLINVWKIVFTYVQSIQNYSKIYSLKDWSNLYALISLLRVVGC